MLEVVLEVLLQRLAVTGSDNLEHRAFDFFSDDNPVVLQCVEDKTVEIQDDLLEESA